MATVDTSIYNALLRPTKSVAEYDAEALANQQNKLALQMSRAKMDEYQRGVDDEQQMRGVVSKFGADKGANFNALLGAGRLKEAQAYEKSNFESAKAQRDAEKSEIEGHFKQFELVGQIMGGARDQASYDLARAQMAQIFPDRAAQMPAAYDPALIEQRRMQAMGVKEQLEQMWKEKGFDLDTQKFGYQKENDAANRGVQIRGQNISAASAAAGRSQSAEQFGISSGQREREIGLKSGGKPMTAQQEAKYRTQIAKDYQAANTILSNMDEVAASAKAVKEAPGLGGATGLQAYIPSYPDSKASQAEVKLQNLEGKVTSLGKAAAAMSGAVGPMAVQEWKIVRDMIAAIDPKKGEKSLKEQIALVEENAKGAADRIRDAYNKHYSADFERYPQFEEIGGKPKQATPAATPKVTSAADYAKVPSGTEYIDPDGKTRRKP